MADEIKPYVAIGPSKELSVTVHKDTFDSGFIAFTIFFGIGLLIVVGIISFFAYQRSNLPPPPPPLRANPDAIAQSMLHTNIGAANNPNSSIKTGEIKDGSSLLTKEVCELMPHTNWSNDHCECEPPYFGPTCSQERHDFKYFAVGTPSRDAVNIDILSQNFVSGKSFANGSSRDTCSDQCSKNSECIGFLYHKDDNRGLCTLLKNDVIVASERSIPYFYDQEATLYMKSSKNLHFEDRIFLGGVTGSIPPRFWLNKEGPQYMQLVPYQIGVLTFAPTYTKIYNGSKSYTGIYCRQEFSLDDINILLERGNTSECYIHHSGSNINLPLDWQYQINEHRLYVVYV